MSEECRNDCLEKLEFPRTIENPPGFPKVAYRIGTYASIREALLRKLDLEPVLRNWTHREADDPGIALLEGAAVLGDILTFYQELYANEAWLTTAQWRQDIVDLVRLTGYRPAPGVGGLATFALEVKGRSSVVVPAGFPIRAQIQGVKQAADFATKEAVTAYPWLNSFQLYRPLTIPNIGDDTREFQVSSVWGEEDDLKLAKGDTLLLGIADGSTDPVTLKDMETVVIEDVQTVLGASILAIKGALRHDHDQPNLIACKLGRQFRHFGHAAPAQFIQTKDGAVTTEDLLYSRSLSGDTASSAAAETDYSGRNGMRVVDPSLGINEFPIEGEIDGLVQGSLLLVQGLLYAGSADKRYFSLARTLNGWTTRTVTWGATAGSATVLNLDSDCQVESGTKAYLQGDIRTLLFQEIIGPVFTLSSTWEVTDEDEGKTLLFIGTEAEAKVLKGRSLFLEDASGEVTRVSVSEVAAYLPGQSQFSGFRSLTLDRNVDYSDFPVEDGEVTVYGNLVDATQGKKEKTAILGSGDHREKFQTFKLPKSPLTYHLQAGEYPPQVPELKVYVNDRKWKRVDSFFDRGSKEEIYLVREDGDGVSWVQFGDGKTGARLPTGFENVTAEYRSGSGAHGELQSGTKPQAAGTLTDLQKVHLKSEVTGGSQPETGEKAKAAAPMRTQGIGRLVSLQDYEYEALAVSGVIKATARWNVSDHGSAVLLTLLMEAGREGEFTSIESILAGYNRCRGPNRFPLKPIQGKFCYVYVQAEAALDPDILETTVLTEIQDSLGISSGEEDEDLENDGLFSLKRLSFGQKVFATQIAGAIQKVEGVVWAEVKALVVLGEADDPAELTTPTSPSFAAVLPCGEHQILRLYKTHLQLTPAASKAGGEC